MSHWEMPGKSNEWFTPAHVFEALGVRFDLDVAAPAAGGDCVPADSRLTWDGLEAHWRGFVWMNPPFAGRNGIAPWLARFFAHGNGIALTPDRTSAPWFWEAWQKTEAVLFTRKIKFLRPDGSVGKSPSNGTALMGVGGQAVAALHAARDRGLGILASPNPKEDGHGK